MQKLLVKYRTRFLTIVTLLIVASLAIFLYSIQFRPSKIAVALPTSQDHPPILMSPEIRSIFNSPFSYLGEGNQAYAFMSADEKFVLKFFKNTPLNSQNWLELFSFIPFINTYLQSHQKRAQRKFERVFNAYEIAHTHDRENCGLACLHLHQSHHIMIIAQTIDSFGIQHSIDLDDHAFIIQKKGEPLKSLLKRELKEGKIELVKLRLKKVVEMYLEEYQKGIFDHDHNLMTNIGFVEERPMRIDVGKIVLDPKYSSKEAYLIDLDKIIHQRIGKWLKRNTPEHTEDVVRMLELHIEKYIYSET